LSRPAQPISELFEIAEDYQFGFQLWDGLRRRDAIHDLPLSLFQFGAARFVEVSVLVIVEEGGELLVSLTHLLQFAGGCVT
jgi:hypothetical protein